MTVRNTAITTFAQSETKDSNRLPLLFLVNWLNIGRTHKDLQLGKLLSLGLTVTLCLLWTIPMTFIASLSSVQGLRDELEFIDDMLNKFPRLVPVFEVAAPMLVIIANSLLPIILEAVTLCEGPISGAVVEAALFVKLAAFMIIQTFFVSAVSGSVIDVSFCYWYIFKMTQQTFSPF